LEPGQSDAGAYRPVAEINVTPLVDVMLVLLIIFMVAAPLMTVGVPVQLPRTHAAKISQPKQPTVVSIGRDGRVFLGEEALGEEAAGASTVRTRVGALAAEDPALTVHVRADREIPYGRVMEVMGEISAAGVARVSLIAEPGPKPTGAEAR
jgi:TolR protein